MGVNFGNYLGRSGGWASNQAALRARVQWSRILDKQFDIELIRGGTKMSPQSVRVELDNFASDESGSSGDSSLRKVIVFGLYGHPDIDDTDIKVWDVFVMHDMEYTVVTVNRLAHGQVQAYCEAVG